MNLPEDHHQYIGQAAGPMSQSRSTSSLQPNQGHDYNGISSEDYHRNVGQTVCPMRHYQDSSSSHFNQGHGYPISDPAHYAHTLSNYHRYNQYNQSSVMYSQQNQMPRSTYEQGHGSAISDPAHYAHTRSYNDRYNQSFVMYSQQNQMPRSTYEQGHGSAISDPAHYAHTRSYNDRYNQTMANNDSTRINPTSSQLSYGASSAIQSNQSEVPSFSSAIHPSHANEKGYPISSSYPIAKDRECDADNPLNIKTPRIAHNSLPNPDYSRHDDLPHTIPIRTDGREIYMYMFHFKSQTSSIQATSITGEENMLITSLLKVNDFAIRDRISLSIDPKKSYQKIMLIRCRGMNRSPPTCCLQFLLIRTDGKLGFYVRMMNCKDASCHKIKHLVGCIPSKIKAPPDLIRNFDESGSGKDKVIHALVEHSTHSSANKKLRRALTQKTHKIKNGFVKAGNDCRATETVAEFKAYCENTGMCMSVEDYCALLKKEGYIHNNLKKIVVLAHDLDDAKDGRWNAVVFTTVGRLLVFMKIIEMAEWKKSITTQIDGTNLLDDIRFMVHGASDYKHQFFPLMFGIVREECKESATMVVRTSIQIFHNLGLKSEIAAHLLRHDILKDGGTALHATARELKLSERACKTHMIERTQGVGTKGQNGRGSMYVYLQNKQLKFKEDEYFFLLVNQSLFSVHGSKAYTTAVVMMFKYMLIDWVVRESGGEVKAFLKNDATEDDVIQVITEQFVCYIPFVSGDTKGDLVREHGGHLHKCEQIIAWFVGFYFRIGLCNSKDNENKSKYVLEPTFGPVHVPGDPFNTNGLESQNHVLQNHAKTVFGSHQVTKYQAALESIRPGSLVPDDLQTRPLHTDADWSNIWKYCEKKKLDVVPLPNYLRHAFIFDSNDPCPLINRADLFSKLGRLRKQHNTGNGIVIYLPSKENYERSMLAAKDSLREEANIGEYPMPPNACHNKTIKDEDRILGPLLDQLFIPQLLDMHPEITHVDHDAIPTRELIASYIYRHASRLGSKAQISQINTLSTNNDLEMIQVLNKMDRNFNWRNKKKKQKKWKTHQPKKEENVEEEYIEECIRDCKSLNNASNRNHESLYQRALGPFIRIEIQNNRVTSNDENFQRYGASFYTRFFGFIVQCENWHPPLLDDRNMKESSEGYNKMSEYLRTALHNLMKQHEIEDTSHNMPMRDPMIHSYHSR